MKRVVEGSGARSLQCRLADFLLRYRTTPHITTSRENEGTEKEAPGPALGICHVHESYF